MSWIAGMRAGKLYSVSMRPLDPRWSSKDLQMALGLCATGLHLGWDENRAFQAAEGIVMKKMLQGISWPSDSRLLDDMSILINGPSGKALVLAEQ
jgi:hypothetical protein